MQRLELDTFGASLAEYGSELKGSKVLDRHRFKWAKQAERQPDDARRKHCRSFFTKGLEHKPPSRDEFTAFGQACVEMARGMFELLRQLDVKLFASVIPATVSRPATFQADEYLRKDHVFLFERFFYFLEGKQEHGLLVLDAVDRGADQRFVRRLERYFMRTQTGRYRAAWIVPVPLFVSSDMTYPVQAADLLIYCINWGFRVPSIGMNAHVRDEIAGEFGPWLHQLQYVGQGYRDGRVFDSYGVCYVPDPYERGQKQERRQSL